MPSKVAFRRRRTVRKSRKLSKTQKKEVKLIMAKEIEVKHAYWQAVGREIPKSPGRWMLSNINNAQDGDMSYTQLGLDVTGQGRVANQIHLNYVDISYNLAMSGESLVFNAAADRDVRIIVFRWMMDNHDVVGPVAHGPNISDILNTNVGVDFTILPYYEEERHKYHIMYDKVHSLANSPYWNGSNLRYGFGPKSTVHVRKRIKGKKLGARKVQYTPDADGTFTLGDGIGQIYAYAVSNTGTLTEDDPSIEFILSLGYTDA